MHRNVVWKIPALVLGLWVLFAAAGTAQAAPKIMSPAPIFNFGEVDNSTDVIHDFVVKNVGSSPLTIKNIKTSCGCTVAELKKKVLEPNEETSISSKFSLKGKTGQQNKVITIESDDPETPHYALQFQGRSVAAVMIEPNMVDFGRLVDDQQHERVVDIKVEKEDVHLNFSSVESTSDKLETELKILEPGKHYQLAVRTRTGIGEGNLTSKINLLTDNPQYASFQVSVFGNVIGDLEVSPNQITLRHSDEAGKTSSQYLRVTPGSVKEFEITEVIVPVDTMSAEIRPRSANDYLIHLQNMPMGGELEGKSLILKTNLERTPEIKIPFHVIRVANRPVGARQPIPQLNFPPTGAPANP